jgi:hypothetical protein
MPVRCDNPPFTLRAPRIEAKVWELMKEKQAYVDANREEIIEQALDDADSSQRTRHEADPGPDYAVQREEYNQQIGRLTREWLTAGLSPEEYRALRLDLETKRDAIPTADAEYSLGNCRQKQDAPNRELIELAVDAFIGMLAYERENSELLNQTLHRYIERIEVKGYDHVEIVWSAPFDSGVVI